jgi:hypothetical protein
VVRIERILRDQPQPIYRRPPPDFSLDDACASLHRELSRPLCPQWRERRSRNQSEHPIVPTLYIGLEQRREALADEQWSPADLDDDPEDLDPLVEDESLLSPELSLSVDEGPERARRLLCAVAWDLNAIEWFAVMPVTDDFIVYPVDLEVADLDRNLAESVPAERLDRLRLRGQLT